MVATEVWEGAGGAWAYERRGAGPLVLLLHGMMFDRSMWRPVAEDLSADHTVVAVDLPGHGASPPREHYDFEDLAGELADLTADLTAGAADGDAAGPPLVVGHSAAALLATVYAARHPVRGAVDVDQPLAIREPAARLQALPAVDEETFARIAELLIASMHLEAIPEPYRALAVPRPRREVFLGWQRPLLETDPDGLQAWVEETARAVTAPYLAVFSREPWPGHDAWLRRLIPQARCDVYGVDGHFPCLADVERFTRSLRRMPSADAGEVAHE